MKERTKNLPSEKSSQLVCFRYRCTYRCAEELISWGYDVATSNYLCAIYKYDFLHEPKYENGWELLYGIRVNRNVDLSHLLWITKQNFIIHLYMKRNFKNLSAACLYWQDNTWFMLARDKHDLLWHRWFKYSFSLLPAFLSL